MASFVRMDQDAVAQFAGITGSSPEIAAQYLRLADNNTQQAIELYFANDGANLEPTSELQNSHRPPLPDQSIGSSSHRRGYEDQQGVVHLDSDQEDDDIVVDNNNKTDQSSRTGPRGEDSASVRHLSSSTMPPNLSRSIDGDEAIARRMQEEMYGAESVIDGSAGSAGGVALDEHGYRAPIGRTTETLVGPDSFDPNDAEQMRAAVMQQMAARRRQPRRQGKTFPISFVFCEHVHDTDRYRSTWHF